jgi:hypothetical protein
MRAAIVLAGTLLFFSSALFAASTGGAASKPILVAVANVSSSQAAGTVEMKAARVAAVETQVTEGVLEQFGATGLPELLVVAMVSTGQAVRKAVSVTKEAQMPEGSLEKFNATGLAQ